MEEPRYLTSIEILKDKRTLNKGLVIELNNITLLVGEQGCGKSTLLELLRDNSDIISVGLTDMTRLNGVNTFYFDTEKMNPRINDLDMYTNPNGTSKGIGLGNAMKSRFMSHGEVLRQFTVNMLDSADECVLFLDEPESALSLNNQYRLAKKIATASKRGVQAIIATHCLPLIESVSDVYSLEMLRWIKSTDYIDQCRNSN